MSFAKNLLIFALFCFLQHCAYSTEISGSNRLYRTKRECGCCSCYGPGSGTLPCVCSSSCRCAPTGAYNYGTGYEGIGYNPVIGGYPYSSSGYSAGYPTYIYDFDPYAYGIVNYNIGNRCGIGGTTACGTGSMFPYSSSADYSNIFGIAGYPGYGYPLTTSCSTPSNTQCYCGTGYSPCSNGAMCCKNVPMMG